MELGCLQNEMTKTLLLKQALHLLSGFFSDHQGQRPLPLKDTKSSNPDKSPEGSPGALHPATQGHHQSCGPSPLFIVKARPSSRSPPLLKTAASGKQSFLLANLQNMLSYGKRTLSSKQAILGKYLHRLFSR